MAVGLGESLTTGLDKGTSGTQPGMGSRHSQEQLRVRKGNQAHTCAILLVPLLA